MTRCAQKRKGGIQVSLPISLTLFPDSFEDSPLRKIPKGWRVGKAEEIFSLDRDTVNPGEHPEEVFDHYSIPAFDEGKLPKQESGEQIKSNKFLVSEDCVLLSKLNPRIPRVWLPHVSKTRRSVCSTEYLVALPKEYAAREFLYGLFTSKSFLDVFATMVTGTSGSHQRVKPEYVLKMDLVLPDNRVIDSFTVTVCRLMEMVASNTEESRILAAIRDALLPKLLSGAIRVQEAEKFVEEVG